MGGIEHVRPSADTVYDRFTEDVRSLSATLRCHQLSQPDRQTEKVRSSGKITQCQDWLKQEDDHFQTGGYEGGD